MQPLSLIAVRAGLVVVAVFAWWYSQALLAQRVPASASTTPLTDGIHTLTARWNRRLLDHPRTADRLLIASSLVIDLLGLYLLASGIAGPTIRPVLGLVCLFALRQLCQLLCPLPPPDGMIWRDPKFPTLLVTYGTSSDLFFSGHTAIAVFGAATLASHLGPALGLPLGLAIAAFEITTVLLLRAHYTADVFAGAVTALWIHAASATWAPPLDTALARLLS